MKKNTINEITKYLKILIPIIAIISIVIYILFFNWPSNGGGWFLIIAGIVGLYMAMNIGANDVANNMGPAVGSKTLTIAGAIIIAAIFEAAGAIIAGGDVVETIKGGIVNPIVEGNELKIIYMMLAALFGSALWINIATFVKAPVSATHSIIGGLVGAGLVAFGSKAIEWNNLGGIAFSWVLSPILGGIIAALLLYSIRVTIFKRDNILKSAKVWVPVYVSFMVFAFTLYLIIKGLKQVIEIELIYALQISLFIGVITYIFSRYYIVKNFRDSFVTKDLINSMFGPPLIFAVALLSFAHGSNDVANAIGPLAAINDIIQNGELNGKASMPFWVILVGAIGLAIGLATFGAGLIKTVGGEITKLNQSRAYCVALSAGITVIIASWLGLPVSSTHIAIGGVFGVGILRERFKRINGKTKNYIERGMIKSIVLAWIVTLPISATISGIIYMGLITFM